jgi:hypothetical protein
MQKYFLFILLLFISGKTIFAQSFLSSLEEKRYLFIDSIPNVQHATLYYAKDTIYSPRIDIFNIFFKDAQGRNQYLLTLSLLPFLEQSTPELLEAAVVKKNKISYEELEAFVTTSLENVALDSGIFLVSRLRTDQIIPVVALPSSDKYVAYNEHPLTECFAIEHTPPPFEVDELMDKHYQYLLDTAIPYFEPNIINIGASSISRKLAGDIAFKIGKSSRQASGWPTIEDSVVMNDVFVERYFGNRTLLRQQVSDSLYHFEIQPSPPSYESSSSNSLEDYGFGPTEFYFHLRLGIVGASYRYYFQHFYNWIPEVVAKKKVMYTAKGIQP